VNSSVNGSTPIDLSSAGVPIYTGVQDLVNAGVTVSDLHGTNGEGYYDGYKLNTGAEGTTVKLSAINTALTDTDGSETLSVKISGAPVGSVLSDGHGHSFTVTASNGEANVTGWSLGSLTVTPPTYYTAVQPDRDVDFHRDGRRLGQQHRDDSGHRGAGGVQRRGRYFGR
jgi:surface adhesion protein